MSSYVMLLRGINVGGRNILPMKDLITLLENLGCRNVRTYIQSGNVVLQSTNKSASRLAKQISHEIHERHGFEPHVLLFELKDLVKAIEANPFPEAVIDPKGLHFGFLVSEPSRPDLNKLEALRSESERFQLIGKVFYLHAPDGIGRSKLSANSERCLGVAMTGRNWRTVCKIRDLAEGLGS